MTRYSRLIALAVIIQALCLQAVAAPDATLRDRAAKGDASAMQELGRSLAETGDPVGAYVWLTLAADRGAETPERANLFNTMTAAQFADASRKLGDIRPTLPRVPSEPAPMPVKPVAAELVAPEAKTVTISAPKAQPVADNPPEDTSARIARLEADLAAARAETRVAKSQSTSTGDQLRQDLDRVLRERDGLVDQISTLRREKSRAEDSRDMMRVDLDAARAKLEAYSGTIREGAPVDTAALRETLRQSEMKVDMTVRAFAVIEQENERLLVQMRAADAKAATAEDRSRSDSSETSRLRAELARAEQGRSAALAARDAALRDLSAAQIRNDNLARELARARPGMPLVFQDSPPPPPSRVIEPEPAAEPLPAVEEPKIHIVAEGENLSIISHRYYNTPNRWLEIFNANKDVMKSENHVVPGMKLRIP